MRGRFVVGCLVACLAAVAACGPECDQDVRQTAASPGGAYVATVYVRNCHATSPFVTIVSIHRTGDAFDRDDYVYAAKGDGAVTVEWASETSLIVRAHESEVYRNASQWGDVAVQYVRPQ